MQWTYDLRGMDMASWFERVVGTLHEEMKPGDMLNLLVGEGPEANSQLPRLYELLTQYGYSYETVRILGVRAVMVRAKGGHK